MSKKLRQVGKYFLTKRAVLPVTSIQGCQYIMVAHDCDSNAILAEPSKYREDCDLLRALTALYKHVTDYGIQPRLHMLDN